MDLLRLLSESLTGGALLILTKVQERTTSRFPLLLLLSPKSWNFGLCGFSP